MITMYGALPNSPEITLTAAITADDTSIIVSDASKYAGLAAPYPMTIGKGEAAETVLVTSVDGNTLTVQRGFEGSARTWSAGTSLSRNFTAYDYNAIINNVSVAASSINGIPVDTSSLADGQLLAYNASQNKIIPLTLKLAAGANITITEDNGTYTISSTGGGGDDMGVGTWINELALYGERSYVGKDIDKILQLITDGQILKHEVAKCEILDAAIANGLHVGTVLKALLKSNDSLWDGLGTIEDFAGSEDAVNAIIADEDVLDIVVNSELAMTAIAASSTAMTAVIASSTAMTAVIASSTAMTAIAASSTAMTAIAASSTAMTAVIASSTAMTAVIASSTAMTAIAASSTAMTAIIASSTAMTAIAASSTAMTAIAASSTAMTAIGNSAAAMSTLWSNATSATQNIIRNSTTAITALRNCSRCASATTTATSETTIYSGNAFVVAYKINTTNSSYYMYVGRDKFTNNFYSAAATTQETTAGFFTHASNTGVRGYIDTGGYTMTVYYIPC